MPGELFFQSDRSTLILENIIRKCNNFEEFEEKCPDDFLSSDCRLSVYLLRLLEHYGKKIAPTSVEARMDASHLGLVINGKRKPNRDMLIRVALAIGATVEETQYLLRYAGFDPLYVRRKRDVIIWFGLSKGEHLDVVNDNIIQRGFTPLYEL